MTNVKVYVQKRSNIEKLKYKLAHFLLYICSFLTALALCSFVWWILSNLLSVGFVVGFIAGFIFLMIARG